MSMSWMIVRASRGFCCVFLLLFVSQIQTENVSRISWVWGDLSTISGLRVEQSSSPPQKPVERSAIRSPGVFALSSQYRDWLRSSFRPSPFNDQEQVGALLSQYMEQQESHSRRAEQRRLSPGVQSSSRDDPESSIWDLGLCSRPAVIVSSLTLPKFNSKAFGYWNNVPSILVLCFAHSRSCLPLW